MNSKSVRPGSQYLRLLIGASYLLTAVLNRSGWVAALQLLICIALLIYLHASVKPVKRAMAVLGWLVAPIILLHALLSPGELIQTIPWFPVSREGVQTGIWLAVHLSSIFLAAMVLMKLVERREWLSLLVRLPFMGKRMVPYLLILDQSWLDIRALVDQEKSRWRSNNRPLTALPAMLVSLPAKSMKVAKQKSQYLWQHWDEEVDALTAESVVRGLPDMVLIILLISAALLWYLILFPGI